MKVSIITPSLNSAHLIRNVMLSVKSQNYPEIEHIIIDGGSGDNTTQIIDSFGDENPVFISEPDNGIYDAINKGIKRATGDIIGILNTDDEYFAENVIEQVVRMFENSDTEGVYGDLVYVRRENTNSIIRRWKSGNFTLDKLAQGWMPPHPALFLKKTVYDMYGLYDTSFSISADYDYILRILGKYKISVSYIPEILIKMRFGGKSNTGLKNIIRKRIEDYRAIRQNRTGGILTLIYKNLSKISQFSFFSVNLKKKFS